MDTAQASRRISTIRGLAVPLVIAAVAVVAGGAYYFATMQPAVRELTWVVTHNPVSVFDQAKDVFVEEFNKDSDIKISIKMIGPDEFENKGQRITSAEVFGMFKAKEVQIATVSMGMLANTAPEASVFSLPYLFKDDAAVEAVFTGSIGQGILDGISAKMPVRALAFTYSGGWLVMQSNTQTFTSASSFANKNITGTSKLAASVLDTLGAKAEPVDVINTSNRELNENLDKYDGVETVFTRLHHMDSPKFVTVTNHALFATAIIADASFAESLSARDQIALQRAATKASLVERDDSRALARTNREDLVARGTEVVELTSAQKSSLAARMQGAYTTLEAQIGTSLIESIRALSK